MLIAVDTNVLMDLAADVDTVWDALEVLRRRMPGARLVVLPTVVQELRFIVREGESEEDARLALAALQQLTGWGFEPVSFLPSDFGLTERVAADLRQAGLLPESEVNDSFILAEAALLGCGLFVSSDSHFAALDFQLLTLELKAADISVPAISSPHEIVRKFHR